MYIHRIGFLKKRKRIEQKGLGKVRTGAVQARAMCRPVTMCIALTFWGMMVFRRHPNERDKCHKNNPIEQRHGGRSMVHAHDVERTRNIIKLAKSFFFF